MPRRIIQRRYRIRPVSLKRQAESSIYRRTRIEFLVANPWCAWGLKQEPPQYIRATQIHHLRGRAGKLFLAIKYWAGVSAGGHQWINDHPAEARTLGLLCELGEWGKQP